MSNNINSEIGSLIQNVIDKHKDELYPLTINFVVGGNETAVSFISEIVAITSLSLKDLFLIHPKSNLIMGNKQAYAERFTQVSALKIADLLMIDCLQRMENITKEN